MSATTPSWHLSLSERVLRNAGTAVGSVFTAVGIAGNILVMFIILRFPRMRTVPNVYLFCIAFSDLVILTVAPIIIHFYRVGRWVFGPGACEAESCIKFTSVFASFFLVSAFNVERYQVIMHPLETRHRQSLRKAALICLSMFLLALVANLPFCVTSIVVEAVVDGRNATVCRYFWPEWNSVPEFAQKARRLYLTSLGFLLPLCLNFTLYVLIIRKLRDQDAFRSAAGGQRGKESATAVTKMAAFVTATFIVCTGPYHMYNFISAVSDIHLSEFVGMWTKQLALGNSALDPIIYALMGTNFRECIKQLFCRQRPQAKGRPKGSRNEPDPVYAMVEIE
ncbi:delta-type opioid receptor-like [Branchiostoma floridae x Branchiostoma japonicum]